ncbi:MAG: OmpW family protein [Fulvimarina manganoxydans]|uniref:OmpW/AlkL family protein n=1 Tax=Fulvimarina manganoxydans TaxID=937218 RepID=UPI0023527CB3|nr:OmpW family protein [Fulvimarina manganoxydans]MCK5934231.1 OmpW family protein [Fulvimarina manganoxydans]
MKAVQTALAAASRLVGILALVGPSAAADLTERDTYVAEPPVMAEPISEAVTPWQVRVRGLGVITRDAGSVDGIPGSDLDYSDSVIPELDISYYFTDNIAAELILGATRSTIHTDGSIAALGEAGSTWVLPPTLTLQYHFTNFGAFKPYLGAGVNYTIFFSEKDHGNFNDLKVDNAFGVALQAGFDYMVDDHWGFNADVKKLFLRPDWSANLGTTPLSGKADLDPWLIGAGVTYRF